MQFLRNLWMRFFPSSRIYVVMCDGQENYFRKDRYAEPYDTDPRPHGLPIWKQEVSDAEFEENYRYKVRAFRRRSDAMKFMGFCNLDSVVIEVFDRAGDVWVRNRREEDDFAEEVIS